MPHVGMYHGPTDREITAAIMAQPACPWCGRRHAHMFSEEECERRVKLLCANGCGRKRHKVKGHRDPCSLCVECCTEQHGGPPGLDMPKNQAPAFVALSQDLADLMPQPAPPTHLDDEGADFVAWSISQGRYYWPMSWTPEGVAVHYGEGCRGEAKRGVCRHMKENHDPQIPGG